MTTSNPTTGQPIKSRANSDAYSDNYDTIFKKPKEKVVPKSMVEDRKIAPKSVAIK